MLAYDWPAHRAAEVSGLGRDFAGWMPWHYPPPVQLLVAPLGALPLFPAMILWVGLTGGTFLWTCWRILPHPNAVLAGFAAAPTALTLVNGQIGFLLAALMGLALLEIDRRPVRAGLLMSLLAFKPHLVAMVPVLLLATGRWRVVLGGAAGVALLCLVAWAALGSATWQAFILSVTGSTGVFSGEAGRFEIYASAYGWLRHLGLGFTPAMAVQGVVSLAVLVALVRAWRDPGVSAETKAALVCFGTLAAAPRVLNYDLHLLVIGALFQVRHALAAGFFRGEQAILGLAAVGAFVSILMPPGATPVLSLLLFWACWWGQAARREGRPVCDPS